MTTASSTTARATRVAGHPKGCLCDECTPLAARYQKTRNLAVHRGTWEPLTDAGPSIALVKDYIAAGWTERQIEYVADLTLNYVRRLLGYDAAQPAPARLRPSTVAAIKAVAHADRLDLSIPGDTLLDPTGSVRRGQALAAGGWSQRNLTDRYSRSIVRAGEGERVTAGNARAMAAAYAELWNVPGPSDGAKGRAANRGWPPPMAWYGLDIDDPRVTPTGWRRGRRQSARDLFVDSEELLAQGIPFDVIATRLDVTANNLERARERAKARAATAIPGETARSTAT